MIWFTSDEHYFHRNIIRYCKRPFENELEMTEAIIFNHNKVVQDGDIVIHLGDFGYGNELKLRWVLNQLKGKHILIMGNHDKGGLQKWLKLGFDWACYEMQMKIYGQKVILKHYPYRPKFWQLLWKRIKRKKIKYLERRPINKGHWLLHGHTHSRTFIIDKQINVGVDSTNFTPVSYRDLEKLIEKTINVKRKKK